MPTLIILLLVTGIFGLIWHIFVTAKTKAREKEETYARMGFTRIITPDSSLLEQIKELNKKSKKNINIKNVFRRNLGHHDLFIYDIDTGDDSGDETQTALHLSRAQYPNFHIFPEMPMKGMFGRLLNRFIRSLATRSGYKEVVLTGQTRFTEKYLLMAESEQTLTRLLPENFWAELAEIPGRIMINAGANLIAFTQVIVDPGEYYSLRNMDLEKHLRNVIDLAERLSHLFGDIRNNEYAHI